MFKPRRTDNLRRQLVAASIAAPVVLALPRVARAETGVTGDKIVIGAFLPLQSGLAAGAAQMRDGADAYFKSVNDAGGIHGRKIEWLVENDSYNPQQAVAVAKKLADRDGVFAIVSSLGTANNLAALPFLVQRKVPVINPAGNHDLLTAPKDPYVFALLPSAGDIGRAMADYAMDKLNAKKIAILYQNDPFGKDPRDAATAAIEKRGLKMVGDASYIPADVDMSAQALALKASDPDAVIMVCIGKQGALMLKEAQRLSWKPKFLAHNTMADPITYELAGDALAGTSVLLFSATKDMNTPSVKEANAIVAKYHPTTQPGYWTSLGMGGAKAFVEAARRAGRDLTRAKLVQALYSFNRYEPGVLPPVDWTIKSHGGAKAFGFAVWRKGGALEVVQGW